MADTETKIDPEWSFTSLDGTKWTFSITYGTVKHVLDQTGFKLTDLFYDDKATAALTSDGFEFMRVMFAALAPQATTLGRSFDDFLAGMDDTVLSQAADALMEAVTDFFREPRRTLIRRAMQKYRIASEKLTKDGIRLVEKKLEEIDFDRIISLTHTNSDSSSPVSAV